MISNKLFIIYYLLYKLKNSDILWIVQISDNYCELKHRIRNISSDSEIYYIVSKKVSYSEIDYEFKQFMKFDYNIHDQTTVM